jgi:hypothetical protein
MRSAEAPPQEAASPQPLDLDAIKAAMDACDTTARQDVGAIHFLVIPLAASDGSPRPKPINIVGNGSLLTSHDALDGLADGSLRLYPAKYDFRVRDDATGTLYKWEPWEGVASFSINDSGAVAQFKVQFLTAKSAATDAWGPSYGRPNASCYWISVVIDG